MMRTPFLYLCISTLFGWSSPVCDNLNTPTNTKVPPMPVLPDAFRTLIETKWTETSFVQDVWLFYNRPDEQIAVEIVQDGFLTKEIYNYATSEVYVIEMQLPYPEMICQVYSTKTWNGSIEGLQGYDENTGVPPPGALLRFSGTEMYQGQEIVRGIVCDHWRGCLNQTMTKGESLSIVLDFFFDASNKTLPGGQGALPIQIRENVTQVFANGTTTHFTKLRDFIDFLPMRSYIWDPISDQAARYIFQTPPNLYCPGRNPLVEEFPPLPDTFAYTDEVKNSFTNVIEEIKVYMDGSRKLSRLDFQDPIPLPPVNTADPASIIQDFNTNLEYLINRNTGTCKIQAMNPFVRDYVSSPIMSDDQDITMKNGMQFFDLDDNYAYTGQTEIRGIVCGRYISLRPYFSVLAGNKLLNATYEYCMLSGIANVVKGTVPLHLTVKESSSQLQIDHDFIDFHATELDQTVFDVSSCFTGNSTMELKLIFKGAWDPEMNTQALRLNFINMAMKNLLQITRVNGLRVTWPHFDHHVNNVYLTLKLFDLPPNAVTLNITEPSMAIAFRILKNEILREHFAFTVTFTDGQSTDFRVTGIENLQTGDNVTAVGDYDSQFDSYRNDATLSSYPLAEEGYSLDECAHMCANNKIISCRSFSYCYGSSICYMTSLDVRINITLSKEKDECDVFIKSYVEDYTKMSGWMGKYSGDITLDNIFTENLCATQCSTNTDFPCKSFFYCPNLQSCVLRRSRGLGLDSVLRNQSAVCYHYKTKPLDDFKDAGKSFMLYEDAILLSALSLSECAGECTAKLGDRCNWFCHESEYCFLPTQTRSDGVPPSRNNGLACTNFTRIYSDDSPSAPISFSSTVTRSSTSTLSTSVSQRQSEVTSSRHSPTKPAPTSQILNKSSTSSVPFTPSSKSTSTKGDASSGCPSTSLPKAPNTQTGLYSKGAMAGLAMGMLVLGAGLSVIILLGARRIRGRREDEMSMSVLKYQQ